MPGDRSTFQRVDGDAPRTRAHRAVWLAAAIVAERLPRPRLDVHCWSPDPQLVNADRLSADATPARALSNLFWESLPKGLPAALGGEVHALDIGCGRGNYAAVLDRSVGLTTYLGVDVASHPGWEALTGADARLAFERGLAETLTEAQLAGRNLIVSQSALEHVAGDLALFRRVAAHVHASGDPVLQVHLLPGTNAWRMWDVHGYRGYGERNLARIGALFADDDMRLLALGGPACTRLHLEAVHDALRRPSDRDGRTADPARYKQRLADAIAADAASPPRDLREATFVGLAIGTGVSAGALVQS
jgi:hypothetical protein